MMLAQPTTGAPARLAPGQVTTVLLATDGRSCSLAATERALALAHDRGARLVAVTVRAPEDDAEAVPNFLVRLAQRARTLGVNAELVVGRGEPGPTILATARHQNADLIVVGHDTTGAANRRGSVAGHVAGRADRPVLVVQRWAAAAMGLPG